MYEPYFPPSGKPQDGYGHISLPLVIIVTNQSFGFPSQRPVYTFKLRNVCANCFTAFALNSVLLSYTIVTYYWQTLLTQVQDDTRY